jgi:methylated-DNA-[protein]-cysteine S-methyltransferase
MTINTIEPSPIGALLLVSNGQALTQIYLPGEWQTPPAEDARDAILDETARQLRAYFAGKRRDFELPLAPTGTPFQRRVWQALLEIPYGETFSYSEIAMRLDAPAAARAVGLANGRNPIPIVIPCHRVIGAGGGLVGYGGGLERKRWLLDLESSQAAPRLPLFEVGQVVVRDKQQVARANHRRGQHAGDDQLIRRGAKAGGDVAQRLVGLDAVQPA